MASSDPTLIVQGAFDNFALDEDADVTWTDLDAGQQAAAASFTRGRDRENDVFSGEGQVTLRNTDRRHEPEHAGSPYYPNVRPNKRFRMRAQTAMGTYDMVNLYADSWDQEYEKPRNADCVLKGTDGFKILGNQELPAAWDLTVSATSPTAWYRMDERSGTVMVDAMNNYPGVYLGTPTFGAAAIAPGTAGSSVTFDPANGDRADIDPPPVPTADLAGAITFRSASSADNLVGAASLTVSRPAGLAEDDVMVAFVCLEAVATVTSAPAGWTAVRNDTTATTGSGGCRQYAYVKVAGPSEPATYKWSYSTSCDSAAVITAWVGVDTAAPVDDDDGTTGDSSSDQTCTAPTVTAAGSGSMLVTGHGFNPSTTTTTTVTSQTADSRMTERADTNGQAPSGSANRATLMTASEVITAGASGTRISNLDANDGRNVGQSIILRPAVTGTAPTPFTVAYWTESPGVSGSNSIELDATNYFWLTNDETQAVFTIYEDLTLRGDVSIAVPPPQGTPLLVVARYDGDSEQNLRVSWTDTAQTVDVDIAAPLAFTAGRLAVAGSGDPKRWDEIVVWGRYLTNGEVDSLFDIMGATTTSTALVGAVLDYAGWATDLRSIQGDGVVMSNLTATAEPGDNVLSYLQSIAVTERGSLYMTKSGEVAFETHDFLLSDPAHLTPIATFGPGVGEIPFREIKVPYDDQTIKNDVRVTNTTTGNGEVEAYTEEFALEDAGSREEFGRATLTLATNLEGTAEQRAGAVQDRMRFEVDLFKEPHKRIRGLQCGPFNDPATWDLLLPLELGDRVTVKHTTADGLEASQDLNVEGIGMTMDVHAGWSATISLSAGLTPMFTYWLAGTVGFGEAGITTRAGI